MMTRVFDRLGAGVVAHPRWVLAGYAGLVLLLLPFLLRLSLEADVRDTLPPDMARVLDRHNALFGSADQAFLLVQAPPGGRQTLLAFAAALSTALSQSPLIRQVEYGYAPELLAVIERLSLDAAPLFVTPEQLDAFDALLTPHGIQTQIHKTLLQLSTMGSGVQDQFLLDDPLQLRRFAFARLASLRGTFRFDTLSPYFLSPDGTALLIKITGRPSVHDMAGAKALVALIEQHSAALRRQAAFQGLTVQATGGYFFAAETERVIRSDMILSVNLTIMSICALLVWTLRRWGVLLYAFLPTLLSLVLAVELFAVMQPTLNALTLGCIASLIGFGMDYAVHVLQRVFNEQSRGLDLPTALRLTVGQTGSSLCLAALTSMACFLAFYASSQPFLHDMGLLAALGMGLSCVLSMTLLPALLLCLPPSRRVLPPRLLGLPTLTTTVLRYARPLLAASLLLSLLAGAAVWSWPPEVETDLRRIHATNSPTLQVQEAIAARFGGSQEPLFLLVEAATEAQAMQALQRLHPALSSMVHDGLLAAVLSPALLYADPLEQQQVRERLLAKDLPALLATLRTRLDEAGFESGPMQPYVDRVQRALTPQAPIDVAAFRALGFDALLRPLLAHDASGAVGVALLFPTTDLWTRAARDAITARVNTALSPHGIRGTLSGLYTISSASATLLSTDFVRITLLAFGSVVLIIALSTRRLGLAGIMLLPVFCGTLWAAGFFAAGEFRLNFMTICILPMLLATSSDYGIYIVYRFLWAGRADTAEAIRVTGLGVLLSALTTLEGFGTLALSVNRGIATVGVLSLVGITTCLLATVVTLPAALHVWGRRYPASEDGCA